MYLFVCIYVCMCVYVCACVCVCTCVCVTWVKLSRALCRLACMPVGGSLVILMAFSRMPCGMMWPSGVDAASALTNTRRSGWLPSACWSRRFSREPSQRATRWMFYTHRYAHTHTYMHVHTYTHIEAYRYT